MRLNQQIRFKEQMLVVMPGLWMQELVEVGARPMTLEAEVAGQAVDVLGEGAWQ